MIARRIRRMVLGAAAVAAFGSTIALAPGASAHPIDPDLRVRAYLHVGTCQFGVPTVHPLHHTTDFANDVVDHFTC